MAPPAHCALPRDACDAVGRALQAERPADWAPAQIEDLAIESLAACWIVRLSLGELWTPEVDRWVVATAGPSWRLLAAWAAGRQEAPAPRQWLDRFSASLQPLAADVRRTLNADAEPLLVAQALGAAFETWRHDRNRRRRTARGVYYTPAEMARCLTAWIDNAWRSTWNEPAGILGAEASGPTLLDPSCGAGIFLAAAVQLARQRCDRQGGSWSRQADSLLPRLQACDLSLPSLVMTHWVLAATLLLTGYDFAADAGPQFTWGNALTQSTAARLSANFRGAVVGNPPFRALSRDSGSWIERLLRGTDGQRTDLADYQQFDQELLSERKHWLHDDYVKFMRLCHWLVEQHGSGVIGLVSNHGYLDNASFRMMRRWLLHDFDFLDVLDLHGNVKKGETHRHRRPGLPRDENVFAIEQGVSMSVWVRRPLTSASGRAAALASDSQDPTGDSPVLARTRHGELWGAAEAKRRRLDRCAARLLQSSPGAMASGREAPTLDWPTIDLAPQGPHYLLAPRNQVARAAFARGAPLPELMPIHSTAPVTARDAIVVAQDRHALLARLRRLADLSIPDEAIRAEMFPAARSHRYPPGDTRGWKLGEARRRLASQSPIELESAIRPCLYRPGDVRWIYWRPWMIDWPRPALEEHLQLPANWLLITRRRMLPQQANFFWASRFLALDGVLRSDNRGSETLFPAWIINGNAEGATRAQANLAPDAAQRLGGPWAAAGRSTGDAHSVLTFLYAQLHSTRYQQRFVECLSDEFPRGFAARKCSRIHTT